ncbi:RGCVC family protein [Amycolatopsis sp. NPDC058278]|uniref:RGCVC family protein n=1 Tax=Amycolatopsis sp. NPDC058278 TaxID=3346417 RepID=UPI0036D7DF27
MTPERASASAVLTPSGATETGGTAAAACAACRHAQHTHDPIARRFCTATVAGGFNRGCVCVGGNDQSEKETA